MLLQFVVLGRLGSELGADREKFGLYPQDDGVTAGIG
jgi:hypothetical protein